MNNRSDNERRVTLRQYLKVLGGSFLSGLGGGTPIIKHPDERIAATSQHWAAVGGSFMSIALAIDLIVRALILRQDAGEWWDIGLIWLITTFVVGIGQVRSGVQPAGATGRLSWRTSGLMIVILAFEVPAILWLMGMIDSLKTYLAYAVISGASAFLMLMIMRAIYSRWERRTIGSEAQEE